MKRPLFTACLATCFGVAMLFAVNAEAGFYKTITIDDVYTDWDDVPVLDSDPLDNLSGADIANVQIANDDEWLYVRTTYHTVQSLGTTIAIDNDNNTATGFDIFGLGLIGSEAGWQNDFDFDQRAGFNIGTLKDGRGLIEPEDGSGVLSSFSESDTRELAVRLDAFFDPAVGAGDVFLTDTFTVLVWTGSGDVSAPISYTLATVPEPSALLIVTMTMVSGLFCRKHR